MHNQVWQRRRAWWAIVLVGCVIVGLGLAAGGRVARLSGNQGSADMGRELFTEVAPRPDLPVPAEPNLLRWRFTTVDGAAFTATAGASATDLPAMTLNLFPDVRLGVVWDRVEPAPSGNGTVWIGHLHDDPSGEVIFVVADGQVTGTVAGLTALYTVRPATGDVHLIAQLDREGFKPD